MIYIIKSKPYVKVADYYKEISIEKKGKEFLAKPVDGENTKVYKPEDVTAMTVEEFYNKRKNSSKSEIPNDIKDID